MKRLDRLYITVDPNDQEAGIKLFCQNAAKTLPGWNEEDKPLPGSHPTAKFVLEKDAVEEEIWEYYEEHKAAYPDIRTKEGQRRFGEASGLKSGAVRHHGIIALSYNTYYEQNGKLNMRLKVRVRGSAYPALINDLCKTIMYRRLRAWVKVKSDVAVSLSRRLHDPEARTDGSAQRFIPFEHVFQAILAFRKGKGKDGHAYSHLIALLFVYMAYRALEQTNNLAGMSGTLMMYLQGTYALQVLYTHYIHGGHVGNLGCWLTCGHLYEYTYHGTLVATAIASFAVLYTITAKRRYNTHSD
ncbi:unnamed protein product, partial [Mesorhabditis spiculigera]